MDHMALEDYQLIISGIEKERFPKSNWNKFFKACEFTNYSWPLLKLHFYVKVDDDVHVNIATLGETLARYRKKPRVYIGCMKSGTVLAQNYDTEFTPQISQQQTQFEAREHFRNRIGCEDEGAGGKEEASERKADLDRWNSCGDEMKVESSRIDGDKTSKSALVDSKSKSSRKHDGGGGEKKEESVGLVGEKEESKSSSKVESKRKSEKDLGRKDKDSKEKKRVLEKKIHETEVTVDGEERQGKRGRENTGVAYLSEICIRKVAG
ncbi:putative beta-1,3-galactosyltransferase 2 [Camellia lanceoleosa]|uniref:Beta-1,3-galactosyltransferase 2 n=1 Tax=Camellia lanceoleosa TaxID=1840588 RepID=A0ACC0FEU7_9ERIC|nr:putative beta-1,3-galactosyltransferase 2 [Camellia lanceoleosa]